MSVDFILKTDMPQISAIWEQSFGESPIELVRPDNTLALCRGNKPAAILSFLPFMLNGGIPAAYIFGVATAAEQRGHGCSTELLERTHDILRAKGFAASVLVPAEDSLFGFYGRRGYETAFYHNRATAAVSPAAGIRLRPVTGPGRLKRLRDRAFGDSALYVNWDENYLGYVIKESKLFGGGVFEAELDGEAAFAVCHRHNSTVLVKELSHASPAVLSALAARFNAKDFVMYLRADVHTIYTNNHLHFGMIKWYDDSIRQNAAAEKTGPAYIAHVLD